MYIIDYDGLCSALLLTSRWYYVPPSCDPTFLSIHTEKAECIDTSVGDLVKQSGFTGKNKNINTKVNNE